jgi:hypothetical protein
MSAGLTLGYAAEVSKQLRNKFPINSLQFLSGVAGVAGDDPATTATLRQCR